MENPLVKFFPAEIRPDGMYIQVTPEARDAIRLDAIKNELNRALVTNYDLEKIRDVVTRARNVFEKIGPVLEYYNPELDKYVDVTMDVLSVSICINSIVTSHGIKISESVLRYCLTRKGIVHGIKIPVLMDIARNNFLDKPIVVAERTPPVEGEPARIVYEIDMEKHVAPRLDKDGKVDFRDIQSIIQVAAGQVIARKEPFGKGTPGKDVTGREMPAQPGVDITIRPGKNTVVTSDGKFLKALKSGYVYKADDVVNVGEQLTIKKDVDFSVGNIKYSGDIEIDGNILPGFTVETDGNIKVRGEAESAKIISRNGSITIGKGVIGKNDMFLSAKTDIHVVFAQATSILAEAQVIIDKFCMHCDITCNTIIGTQPSSAIVGGNCTVYSHIEIGTLGNEKGIETKLTLVDKEEKALGDKISQLEELKIKLEVELEPVKKQLRTKSAILKQAGTAVSSRQSEELKKWLDMYNKLASKLKYVQDNISALSGDLKKPRNRNGYIKVSGDIFPGTELNVYGMTKVIKTAMINKIFRVKDGAINIEG